MMTDKRAGRQADRETGRQFFDWQTDILTGRQTFWPVDRPTEIWRESARHDKSHCQLVRQSIRQSIRPSIRPLVRHAVVISYINQINSPAYLYATDAVVYAALFMSKYYHYDADVQSTDNEIETGLDSFQSFIFSCTNGRKQGSNMNTVGCV